MRILLHDSMIHILIQSDKEAKELHWLLNRALNVLNPQEWPEWAQTLVDKLENCENRSMSSEPETTVSDAPANEGNSVRR